MANNQGQQYSIRWNNYHSNLLTVFDELLVTASLADVTLCLDDGRFLKCHKVVLAACSTYFQDIFFKQSENHIVVALKDVDYCEIQLLLEYMYRGEVNIAQEQMESLVKLAKSYRVKGLGDIDHKFNLQHPPSDCNEIVTTMTSPYSPPRPGASNISSSIPYGNNKMSPPHSTEACYRSQGVITEEEKNFYRYNVPFYQFPMCHVTGNSTPKSDQASSLFNMQSSEEYTQEETIELIKKKRRMMPKYPIAHDTPILRTVLGQRHIESAPAQAVMSSDSNEARSDANASVNERGIREIINSSAETFDSCYNEIMDDENKQPAPPTSSDMNTSQQKPEWKRYKQYTREDIGKAIEAVKTGMSALQASRLHGVPSRTLYDKVKKLGISSSRNVSCRPPKRKSGGGAVFVPFGITPSNYGPGSGFVPECDSEASNSNFKHDNNVEMKTETSLVSVNNVNKDLTGESMVGFDQTDVTGTSELIKQEEDEDDDERYANYEDEVQDLSMHSKNVKAIPASTIKDTDSDNTNRN